MQENKKGHHDMPIGMDGHDHHKMMTEDFKRRFYVVLILTVPIMVLSRMIQHFLGVNWQFPGSHYLLFALSTAVFRRSDRSLSHGCVRLSNAPKLAYFLLRNSRIWTPKKIDSAMNSGHEKFLRLENPVPVIITYYTSWVNNKGVLKFADDIYHHDKEMADKMFANPQ